MSGENTRRRFLRASAISLGGTSSVSLGRAPAAAEKRELTFLTFNHFVPASDDELKRQAEVFGKQAGVTVRVDTVASPQLFAKPAAQVVSQSGRDMIVTRAIDSWGEVRKGGEAPRRVS
jgi:ABC-type glycerol-3-phosphate transport system substrate-binding protein